MYVNAQRYKNDPGNSADHMKIVFPVDSLTIGIAEGHHHGGAGGGHCGEPFIFENSGTWNVQALGRIRTRFLG